MAGFKGYKRSIVLDFDYDSIKKGVPDVNKQMALLNAEFRKASEEAKGAGSGIDKLGLQYDKLSNQIKIQGDKVKIYRDELTKLETSEGNNEKAIARKTIELKNAETAYIKMENELSATSAKMEAFGKSTATVGEKLSLLDAENDLAISKFGKETTAIEKLQQQYSYYSEKMDLQKQNVKELKIELKILTEAEGDNEKAIIKKTAELKTAETAYYNVKNEVTKTNTELNKQCQQLGLTREEWDKVSQKTKEIGTTMTTNLTVPIVAAGVGAFKLASDMTETLSKTEVAFKQNAEVVKKWSETSLQQMGLARATALTMASDYASMANGMGLNEEKTLEMSQALTQLAVDLASLKNTSVEMAKTALTGIFTGETEALKQYGVVMTEANLQQYALAHGIKKKVSEMEQDEKVMLRNNFVLDTAIDAQGDFARTSENATAQIKMFGESIKELGASFGEVLLPIITPVITLFAEIAIKMAKMSEGTRTFLTVALMVVAVIGPILLIISQMASMINGISSAISNVSKGMSTLSKAGSLFSSAAGNATYLTFVKWAAAIVGVVLAITALIVAINYLIGRGKDMNSAISDITGSSSNVKNSLGQQMNNTSRRAYAIGTQYHRGGHALVGEYGPEDVWLPEGSRVSTASDTRKRMQQSIPDNSKLEKLFTELLARLDKIEAAINEQPRKQQQLTRMGVV